MLVLLLGRMKYRKKNIEHIKSSRCSKLRTNRKILQENCKSEFYFCNNLNTQKKLRLPKIYVRNASYEFSNIIKIIAGEATILFWDFFK